MQYQTIISIVFLDFLCSNCLMLLSSVKSNGRTSKEMLQEEDNTSKALSPSHLGSQDCVFTRRSIDSCRTSRVEEHSDNTYKERNGARECYCRHGRLAGLAFACISRPSIVAGTIKHAQARALSQTWLPHIALGCPPTPRRNPAKGSETTPQLPPNSTFAASEKGRK